MISTPPATTLAKDGSHSWPEIPAWRVAGFVIACTAAAAYQALRMTAVTSTEIWWHLRTGVWILQNHAIPRSGLFSQSASSSWVDAGWGFDLLLGVAHRLFGLAGLPILLLVLQIAIAFALFHVARSAGADFWPSVWLAITGQLCILPLQLRPAFCSIFFLAIELAFLLECRRTRNGKILYWLPVTFLLWINLDRQFVYGLVLLVLFCAVSLIGKLRLVSAEPINPKAPGWVTLACLLVTFLSPYGWKLHSSLWQSAINHAADRFFRELHSLRFHGPQDYLLMLLTMTAFFALGRKRPRDPFLVLLLGISAAISFRYMRDSWLVVIVSVGTIAGSLPSARDDIEPRRPSNQASILALACATALLVAAVWRSITNDKLMATVARMFPVAACDYIRQNQLAQPLFNSY